METLNTIADALVLGAMGRQWAATHERINVLYMEMKNHLGEKYPGVSLAKLEESPQSGGVRFLLKEDLSNIVASEDDLLVQTAQALIAAANENNPELVEKLTPAEEEIVK